MRYRFADCDLDTDRLSLCRAGETVPVEPQVFDLIRLLIQNPDRVVTRDEIIETVWGGRIVSDSAISARIAAARKAVGDDGKRQAVIRTVARRGLQMAVPVEPAAEELSGTMNTSMPGIRYTKAVTGHALAYCVTGTGPPVVRTYPATHLEAEWLSRRERALFDLVCEKNTLIRFDHLGTGMSDRTVRVNFEEWRENIGRVADAANVDRFAVLSESGGVHAALRFAATHPDRVSRMAIVGGYVDGRLRREEDPLPDFLRSMMDERWSDPHIGLSRAFQLSYYPDGPLDEVMEHGRVTQAACNVDYMRAGRDAINTVSNAELLGMIRCPTLILHGRYDAIHPLSEAQKLAAGIDGAELVVLETANHLPMSGHGSWPAFADALRKFLDAGT